MSLLCLFTYSSFYNIFIIVPLQHTALLQMNLLEDRCPWHFWSASRMTLCQDMVVERPQLLWPTASTRNSGINFGTEGQMVLEFPFSLADTGCFWYVVIISDLSLRNICSTVLITQRRLASLQKLRLRFQRLKELWWRILKRYVVINYDALWLSVLSILLCARYYLFIRG